MIVYDSNSPVQRAMRVISDAQMDGRLSAGDAMILNDIVHHRDLPATLRQDQTRAARKAGETIARLKTFLAEIEASIG